MTENQEMAYRFKMWKQKELDGQTNQEYADQMNKEFDRDWTESAWRKPMQQFEKALAAVGTAELQEIVTDLEIKKQQSRDMRTLLNKDIRRVARTESFSAELAEKIPTVEPIKFNPKEFRLGMTKQGNRGYVMTIGDMHFGKVFAGYDTGIITTRLQILLAETIDFIQKNDVEVLHIVTLGDMLEGATLRPSQLASLEFGMVDQVLNFVPLFGAFLQTLSEHTNVEVHYVTSSNHEEIRPHGSKRGEFPEEDMGRITARFLESHMAPNRKVTIHIYKDGIVDFSLRGEFDVIAFHGHQFKGKNLLEKISYQRKKFYDVVYQGHFHHENTTTVQEGKYLNNAELISCPSFMGTDGYAEKLLTGARGAVHIDTFDTLKGRIGTKRVIF